MKRGIFIHLDRHEARLETLFASMQSSGVNCNDYQSFRAAEPPVDAPGLQRGLETRGRVGIWHSMILFTWHPSGAHNHPDGVRSEGRPRGAGA